MILEATNVNRSYAAKAQPLNADFASLVIDFKDMPMGSIHAVWAGVTGVLDGQFKIYASDFPEISSFDLDGTQIDGGEFVIHNNNGSRIWIRDRLSFRYALVRYTANGVTGGTVDIVALGKKS